MRRSTGVRVLLLAIAADTFMLNPGGGVTLARVAVGQTTQDAETSAPSKVRRQLEAARVIRSTRRVDPKPLADYQLNGLAAEIEVAGLADREIWFIYLQGNKPAHDGWLEHRVTVYFAPTERTGRIWTGEALMRSSENLGRRGNERRAEAPEVTWKAAPGRYKHVLPAADVKNEMTWPEKEGSGLPFRLAGDIPDETLIAIVDFIRSQPPTAGSRDRIDGTMPIMEIRKARELDAHAAPIPEGAITVVTGTQEGGLSGFGQRIVVAVEGGQVRVVQISTWVS